MFSDILLTVDYDRTLTGPDSKIPERNLEAIAYFMENGGIFTVNTGRSVPTVIRDVIPYIQVNAPLLLYTGSAMYDVRTGALSHCKTISLDPYAVVEDLQTRFPMLTVEIQGIDAHYTSLKNPKWEAYCENMNCAWAYMTPDGIPGPFLKFTLYGEYRDKTLASMCQATPEDQKLFEEATNYIKERYGEYVDTFRACARIIDMHAKGCSKLRAARDLQAELGRKILVCIGDGENDLAMLQGADYAFCPADGVVADRFKNVCPCGEGAVADVIYKKLPEIIHKEA